MMNWRRKRKSSKLAMAGVPPIYRQNHSAKSREWYIPATACCQAVELKMPVVFTIDPLFVGRWGGMIFFLNPCAV